MRPPCCHYVHAIPGFTATPAPHNPKEPREQSDHHGRLARPATIHVNADKTRANFTLAVDGYAADQVSWIPVTCFGRTAELVAEHTDKGHLVAIEGRITSGKYVNEAGDTI